MKKEIYIDLLKNTRKYLPEDPEYLAVKAYMQGVCGAAAWDEELNTEDFFEILTYCNSRTDEP